MSFRKRNIPLTTTGTTSTSRHPPQPTQSPNLSNPTSPSSHPPGTRPSYLDSRLLTTSTGSSSLDELLAGHGGLALGTSVLIEENGTTDYAGTLLRYCAAEGVVQGHVVFVIGAGEEWGRGLPGLIDTGSDGKGKEGGKGREKMKIAWRYERLGDFNAETGVRVSPSPVPERNKPINPTPQTTSSTNTTTPFCHTFDLTKRLTIPSPSPLRFIPTTSHKADPSTSPFTSILQLLHQSLTNTSSSTLHRLIIPTLLSPLTYPAQSSQPHHILQFLHSVRALLRQHPNQLTAMISLPLDLYPRSTGLVRWMELLSDGVLELTPFPHPITSEGQGTTTTQEDQPQGMLHLHRLPVFHERGGDGGRSGGMGEDLAFTLTRKRFVIRPFSLPPVEGGGGGGDLDAPQRGEQKSKLVANAADLEF